jgi:hypothetical protein
VKVLTGKRLKKNKTKHDIDMRNVSERMVYFTTAYTVNNSSAVFSALALSTFDKIFPCRE